jgi:CheY-like chemotaxis protein
VATKPTILAVDDDPVVTRDLRARYGGDYRVLSATSGDEALQILAELSLRERPIALVASDQRMPRITGIEVLAEVRRRSPATKLLLLTAYTDTDVAIEAINQIGLDYYLLKPCAHPTAYDVTDGGERGRDGAGREQRFAVATDPGRHRIQQPLGDARRHQASRAHREARERVGGLVVAGAGARCDGVRPLPGVLGPDRGEVGRDGDHRQIDVHAGPRQLR